MRKDRSEHQEVYLVMKSLIENYGLHPVSLAMMQVIDDITYRAAHNEQNSRLAKKWAACADIAADFEKVVLLQFGE